MSARGTANAGQSGAAAAATPYVRKEKVPLQLNAGHLSDVKLQPGGLKGKPIVVTITDGEYTRQLTVHRPVGKHYLQEGVWVVTPTNEVQTFLNAADDSATKSKSDALEKVRTDFAVSKKLYAIGEGGVKSYVTKNGEVSFAAVAKERQTSYDAAKADAHKEYLEQCRSSNKTPKSDWKFGEPIGKFTPAWVKEFDSKIDEDMEKDPKTNLAILKIKGSPYITRGGPQSELYQRPLKFGTEFDSGKLIDEIQRQFLQAFAGKAGEVPDSYRKAYDDYLAAVAKLEAGLPKPPKDDKKT